ncbi:DegV family protein [Exiguobacterium indicum]|uniref:DegV family protein n=1 Tax=Exiguobacterium indicum TaxID=296995 RepID=UPI003981C4ED
MTKIAWVTDSMAYFTKEEAEAIGVNVVPIQILLGDTAYQENAITVERLFRALDADKKLIAKTSQPIFGEFVGTYERLKEEGYDCAIAVHCTNGLSSTVQSSASAAEAASFPVHIIDSHTAFENQQEFIRYGMELAAQGKSVEEIVAALQELTKKTHFYMIVGNMETMRRGGRVSSGDLFLANLLSIKPIITTDEAGKIVPFKKARSLKKAYIEMVKQIDESMRQHTFYKNRIYVATTMAPEMAAELRQQVAAKFPDLTILEGTFGPAIGTHAGAETVGLFWMND